jgi:hypothetical protein
LSSGVPLHLQRVATLLRRPVAVGHHGHALPAAVQRHGEHGAHAGQLERRRAVQARHLAVEDRRARHQRSAHAGQAHVHAIALLAGALGGRHLERGGLADEGEGLRVLQRHLLRHRLLHGTLEQLAIAGKASTPDRGLDQPLLGLQLRHRHAPLLRRRRQQHGACARPQLAVLGVAVLHRVAAAGEVHAHHRVDIGRALVAEAGDDLGPVGVQLLGTDHRQRGLDALAHVHAVAQDGGGAVARDADEGGGLLGGLAAGLGWRGRCRCLRPRLRQQGQAEAATHAEGDEAAAREGSVGRVGQAGGGLRQQSFGNHGSAPLQASAAAASLTAARMRA